MLIKQILRLLISLLLVLACSLTVTAQETAKPKSGDGISSFLRRHNRTGADYQKQFIELNKQKLGRNNTLKLGVTYKLPPLKKANASASSSSASTERFVTGKKGREPLFGKSLASYEIISEELKGATFYVVSGHGGPDPGAIGKMGRSELHEDEYAYDIALRLARNLMMRGAKVHIIIQDAKDGIRDERILKNSKRETCMGATIPLKQFERLAQRCDKINSLYNREKPAYSRAIFIHIDSRSRNRRTDVFFYHSSSSASKNLAQTMKSTFSKKYDRHQPGRGFSGTVDERGLYVLKKSTPVALFVELGNIQNNFDQQRIILNNNRQALANWMCEGFMDDYANYRKKKK